MVRSGVTDAGRVAVIERAVSSEPMRKICFFICGVSTVHKYEVDRDYKEAEGQEMVPVKGLAAKRQYCEYCEYHQ